MPTALERFIANQKQEAEALLGMPEYSEQFFLGERSEAQALLMLYSCIELAFKKAMNHILREGHTETSIQGTVLEAVEKMVEDDSRGINSPLLKAIEVQLIAVFRKIFTDAGQTFNRTDFELVTRTTRKMHSMRNRIAHAACLHLDKSLREIDPSVSFTIRDAFYATDRIVGGAARFVRLHNQEIEELAGQMTAEDWAADQGNPYD